MLSESNSIDFCLVTATLKIRTMKFITTFLTMLIMGITLNLSAEDGPISTLGTITTTASTAVVPITANNFNNIKNCTLTIRYDPSIVTPTSVTKGSVLNGTLNSNVSTTGVINTPGVIKLGWLAPTGTVKSLSNGSVLFNITFDKVEFGTSSLIFDETQDSYDCQFYNASYKALNDIPASTYYIPGSITFNPEVSPITTAPILKACSGNNIDVPVTVKDFNNIGSVSLTLKYDATVLTFNSGTNTGNYPDLQIGSKVPGTITIGGFSTDPDGYSLANGSVLFTLNFTYLGGNSVLSWNDEDGSSCQYAGRLGANDLNDTPQASYYINGSVGSCQATPTPTIVVGTITNPLTCGGKGIIPLTFSNVTNGTYTISYDGGSFPGIVVSSNAASISALAGTYNNLKITVNGITSAAGVSASLIGPSAPDKPVLSVTQPTCANPNGSVAVTSTKTDLTFSTDGTNYAPYSTPFIVAAGTNYSITAKNLSECVSIAATGTMGAALTAPDKPVLSVIQPTCENPNGSVAVTSDKSGLSFSIDGSNYTNTNGIFAGLIPGNYHVTAKNNAGCVSPQSSFTINENQTTHGQWLGITSDWDKDFNWCGGIPTSSTDVSIPMGVIQPVIGVSSSASCNDINIAEGATLTIASNETGTGSLIVSGTVSGAGSVVAQRYLNTGKWNYVSSPVSGQSIHNFLLANDNIALDENTISGQEHADATIRGMMDYIPVSNIWNDYFTNATVGNLGEGKGFCMRTTTDGAVSFTGNLQTGSISVSASAGYWNCIGNPYTSAIQINGLSSDPTSFLNENTDNLDDSYGAIYVWDKLDDKNGGDNYTVYSNASIPYDFQQGQAFMIKMKSSASQVIFKPEMQVHDPGLELKSTKNIWPTIKLAATFNAQKSSTIIAFNNGMTNGLDPTYDAGLLKAGSDLSVFSRLVEDNGIPFAIQALPLSDLSGTIIPIGLDFKTGGEVAFSAELLNLPSDGQVILEDKLSKAFTDLSKEVYKTYISANTSVSDRFQIHISSLTTGVKIDTSFDSLSAFAIRNVEIRVKGQVSKQAVATLYDIQGRAILIKNLEEGSLNIIQTPNIRSGIYMLSVKDNGKIKGFKIPVRE
jgi:hypothetical protein